MAENAPACCYCHVQVGQRHKPDCPEVTPHAATPEAIAGRERQALERIAGFTLSQFMGPHDMALECVNVAASALAAPSADRAAAPVGQPAAQAVEVRKENGK
jgi:hypothetical protein